MASMISHEWRLLFIHIPKTGGVSITNTLDDLFEPVCEGVHTHRRVKDFDIHPEEYFKFAVIRNPWDMCVSWYFWHLQHGRNVTLETAVEGVETPRSFQIDQMDYVLRFENLQQDFFKVCDLIQGWMWQRHKPPIPKVSRRILWNMNRTSHEHYRKYYTPKLRDEVARRFAWEISEFRYKF